MAHRSRVPAKFHSELTEYSHLLKTLRTNRTLDLTYHLSQDPALYRQTHDGIEEGSDSTSGEESKDVERDEEDEPIPGPSGLSCATSPPITSDVGYNSARGSSPSQPSSKAKGKQPVREAEDSSSSSSSKTRQKRCGSNDIWTRWPLLAGDVPVPEWTFEDEVRLVAEKTIAVIRRRENGGNFGNNVEQAESSNPPPCDSDNLKDTDDPDLSTVLPAHFTALPAIIKSHLASLLAALAHHTPLVKCSLYPRLRPMSWVQVLNCAGACALVSPRVLERAQRRIESIYGPTQLEVSPSHRASRVLLALKKRNEIHKRAFDDIFSLQGPPKRKIRGKSKGRPKKRERVSTKKKSAKDTAES